MGEELRRRRNSINCCTIENNNGIYPNHNTALGYHALLTTLGGPGVPAFDNTAVGHDALRDLHFHKANNNENTAVGSNALKYATHGENTAVGANALENNGSATANSRA